MIALLKNKESVINALENSGGSDCIKSIIELYMNAYGTDYDFAQFYTQYDSESNKPTSVIFRYNQTVYVSAGESADFFEISVFIRGFTDCTVCCDSVVSDKCPLPVDGEICAIMCKKGEPLASPSDNVSLSLDAKRISELVTSGLSENKQTDFFLNTAHLLRHGMISVFAYEFEGKIASVVAVSCNSADIAVITFVYTDEYFRGNGYCRNVLSEVCSDPQKEYQLLCEEQNIKFYEKCGFSQIGSWVMYRL